MSEHEIIVTDTVNEGIEEIIGGGLNAYNGRDHGIRRQTASRSPSEESENG